eukprot:1391554-Amorphochlora_amoeboformis.AAC.1
MGHVIYLRSYPHVPVCTFCQGSGYLTCGICAGSGIHEGKNCNNCASLGKVMCTSCAATGKKVFSEHDPRIDPFSCACLLSSVFHSSTERYAYITVVQRLDVLPRAVLTDWTEVRSSTC